MRPSTTPTLTAAIAHDNGRGSGRGQIGHGIGESDIGTGDGRGTGAPVGLQYVTVDRDGVLTQRSQIDTRPKRPSDQAADLLRPATDTALDRLAVRAVMSGRGKHRVFGGEPALPGSLTPARHALCDARGTHHPGLTELHQHRACRVSGEAAGDGDRS
jgi:hypothetical protein